MELLQTSHGNTSLQAQLLHTLSRMLDADHGIKSMWRQMGGFECVFAALSRLDGAFGAHHTVRRAYDAMYG